jgi:hypothetical protein
MPLTASCSSSNASIPTVLESPKPDSLIASSPSSLSEQYEKEVVGNHQRSHAEGVRQLKFLSSHILYVFPPGLSAFHESPYPFAYSVKGGGVKVFVCDEVRDGLVPVQSKCWLSEGESWNDMISVKEVVNRYPKSVAFTVFYSRSKKRPARSFSQETIFHISNGQVVPLKTYYKSSEGGGIEVFEGANKVINKGCTVGGQLGTIGAPWSYYHDTAKLMEDPEYRPRRQSPQVDIENCLKNR